MLKKFKKNNKGVTLLEMVIAVSIFSVTIIASSQILIMVLKGQRNAVASGNLQESMRYAYEIMSKEIRNAQLMNSDCDGILGIAATKKVYNTGAGGTILYFKNKNGECVAYSLVVLSGVSRLFIERDDGAIYKGGPITPNEIEVTNLSFDVVDDDIAAFHDIQPKVTMRMHIEVTGMGGQKLATDIQTTITSRHYE
jgi:prepilin-type N-terminal cleavage/methylation domain-containing protein